MNPQIPRTVVPHTCHSAIDSILKDLKTCSRRIRYAMASHADELRLIQRIYYKSKNQHRGALFWRRLVEVRRYSERLSDAKIFPVLEELRASFFGPEAKENPKLLKGSWTHIPQKKYVMNTLDYLQRCRALLQKMQDRLLEAYRSFTLAMQSGAFVQLLLVIVAMTSRIRALSVEILEALSMTTSSLDQFVALDVPDESPNPMLPPIHDETVAPESSGPSLSSGHDSLLMQQITSRVVIQRQTDVKQQVSNTTSGRSRRFENVQKAKKVKTKKPRDEIDDIFLAVQ